MTSVLIQVRKMVAVELTFLGPAIIIAEYSFAVVLGAVRGALSLRAGLFRTHATWQILIGIYLLFLAQTYAVLRIEAIAMAPPRRLPRRAWRRTRRHQRGPAQVPPPVVLAARTHGSSPRRCA